MHKFIVSTLLTGLISVLIGCGESDSSLAYEQGKNSDTEPKDSIPASEDTDVGLPATIDLQEPTPEAQPTANGELIIGDAAPPISISKWVNGAPVNSFARDKVYVVEFWATWCGPCLASMPHIASLQKEYGDEVTFIGVSAEDDEVVTEFMGQDSRGGKLWSEVLTYTIALDEENKTNTAYMQASGQNGIPCAFIVGKSGKVEWIGHPIEIDEPLQQVVNNSWDLKKARNEFVSAREAEAVMREYGPKIQAALQKEDFKTGVSLLDQLVERFPGNNEIKQLRFQLLLKGEMFDEANKTAEALIKEATNEPLELNQLAWILATGVPGPGPDLDLAMSAAKRAEELTESKNASILDTIGRILFKKGNLEEAIAVQKRAVELADSREKTQFEDALQEFEAALNPAAPAVDAQPTDSAKGDPEILDKIEVGEPPASDGN